jgi:uncharacterized membrane protein
MLVASHVSSRQVNDEATPLIPGQWKSPRIEVLDILRGFIMVIMAVDHIGCLHFHVEGSFTAHLSHTCMVLSYGMEKQTTATHQTRI